MKIVEVKAVFCFRTFIVSQKNKKHEMKFFVNMCESEYLERPACEAQGTGYSWKVPNSMGKIRYDQDRSTFYRIQTTTRARWSISPSTRTPSTLQQGRSSRR